MEPDVDQGQVAAADPAGTTDAAPEVEQGQSISPDQTTGDGPDVGATGESFFDPKSIQDQPELLKAYKQMQGKFTQSQQAVRAEQAKIDAYNAAMADPTGTVRQLAAQYGMTVVDGQPQAETNGKEFSPQSWDDVVSHIRTQVASEMNEQYAPIVNEVKSLKQQNIEQYLDSNYADWRTYENEMIGTLQKHPSMASDPDVLYRLSVPQEVIESRATERALAKLRSGADAGAVAGVKPTRSTSDKPTGKLSFNEAVAYAKAELAKKGIRGPVGG